MRYGVLGTGEVGQRLGEGLVQLGHEVRMGSRSADNEAARNWASARERASHGTFAEAAAFGERIMLATLWSGTENAIRLAGVENLRGKLLIDATNPLDFSTGRPQLALGDLGDSGGQRVQRWTQARCVKAFNTVGNAFFFRPQFAGGPPTMFIAGDDAAAKRDVTELLDSFGWETLDCGTIDASRYLEAMCMVWVGHGRLSGSWHHAFKMLH